MGKKKKKAASELTTEEVMRRVFPAKVRNEAAKEVKESTGKASSPKKPNSK